MKKILLIEDDQNFRDLYTEILSDAGYSIDTASDGELGLSKISSSNYDLVLLDMMLPKMDGLSVLASVKKSPPKNFTGKIVVLSNLSQDVVVHEALKLGASDHIAKHSLNPQQLIQKVRELLD